MSEDQTKVVEHQTEGKETAKSKQKAAKAANDKTAKATKDKTNDKTEKEPAFVWADDETAQSSLRVKSLKLAYFVRRSVLLALS